MTFRDFRQKRGLTLEAVGYLAGVDAATISRMERGLVEPRPETIVKLSRVLGISVGRMRAMLPASPTAEVAAR
jgi:transcriptional regulator with XRE-family HTH domain